jgi:hypothetical protein
MKALSFASLAVLSAFAFGAVACGGPHYKDHEVDSIKSPTGGTLDFNSGKIKIPLGGAVKAHIVAYDSEHHRLGGGVTSDQSGIVAVGNEFTGDDDWVFFGVTPGTTVVHLLASGQTVRDIQAEVVDVQDTSNPNPSLP